jgi:hypothetical protein
MFIENKKKITGVEKIRIDTYGNNTVAFCADIPANAVVDSVIVHGVHLGDYAATEVGVTVEFPRSVYAEGERVVAVLRSVYDGNAVIDLAKAYAIADFDVLYHLEAIAAV